MSTPSSPPVRVHPIAYVVLALCLLPPLTAALVLTQRAHAAHEALLQAAWALDARRYPRASHVDAPLPGTFGEHFAPLGEALSREAKAAQSDGQPADNPNFCTAVREGTEPLSALTPRCREVLTRADALVDGALRATHAAEGGPPEGLRVLSDPKHPVFGVRGWLTALHVARMAGLRIRLLVAEGKAEEALYTCVDTLALGRDASIGGGLVGSMVGVAITDTAAEPCGAALDAAPAPALARAAGQLARIHAATPRLSETLLEDWVFGELNARGVAPGAAWVERLPPSAQAVAREAEGLDREFAPWFRWAMSWLVEEGLREMGVLHARMAQALDLPRGERERRIAEVNRDVLASLNPITRMGMPDFSSFALRHDARLATLDALTAAARLRERALSTGRWPEGAEREALLAGLSAPPELHRDGPRLRLRFLSGWKDDADVHGELPLHLASDAP